MPRLAIPQNACYIAEMADHQSDRAELEALRTASARLGANPLLVQGAGGNTSIKQAGTLWIKASGTWLADAGNRDIFVPLDLAGVRRRLAAGDADPATPEVREFKQCSSLRPSIETTLHALMPHTVVIHVHSVSTIAHAVRADGQALLARRLANLRWVLVPYARPGVPLTRAVEAAMRERPDVLVLANHGLVVAADTVEAATGLLDEVERRLSLSPRRAPAPEHASLRKLAAGSAYCLSAHEEAHAIATDRTNLKLATAGALYPDHVVFLGFSPLAAVEPQDAASWIAAHHDSNALNARLLLVSGLGVLIRQDAGRGAEQMVRCLALVLPRIDSDAPVVYLSAAQEAELLGWDAEKHRQSLDRTSRWG